jgi:hypothetical protein
MVKSELRFEMKKTKQQTVWKADLEQEGVRILQWMQLRTVLDLEEPEKERCPIKSL